MIVSSEQVYILHRYLDIGLVCEMDLSMVSYHQLLSYESSEDWQYAPLSTSISITLLWPSDDAAASALPYSPP